MKKKTENRIWKNNVKRNVFWLGLNHKEETE